MKKIFIQKIIILLVCIAFFATLIGLIVGLNKKDTVKVQDPNIKDVRTKKKGVNKHFKMSLKDIYEL